MPAQPSHSVGVVETSVLLAARLFMGSNTGHTSLYSVYGEFARGSEVFVNFLHNLLLFEELRTDLSICGEDGWYNNSVMEMIEQLQGVVSVTGMPQQAPEEQDELLDAFATAYANWLNRNAAKITSSSPFSAPIFYQKRVDNPTSSDERIYDHIRHRVTETPITRELDKYGLDQMGVNGAFLFRGLGYAAHANFLAKQERRAAAYSASPGRIMALAYFLDPAEIVYIPLLQSDYLPLIEHLDLPQSGYDFSYLKTTLRPVGHRGLTDRLLGMAPRLALDRVLEIRQTTEGSRVRQIGVYDLARTRRTTDARRRQGYPVGAF